MNLNEYQTLALRTANPRDKKNELFHLLLGLCGEAGEIAEKTKKIIRDYDSDFSKLDKDDLTKELGDVLWHVATISDYFDIELETVGAVNIKKLASRLERGTLSGSGDNR
jgi:NTP pyrophosphatase (non-canonical NTP hydrolase)